ncbi:hypothetical protein [Rhizobium viscosum]|uniref:DNA mismatch repair protein MutT n=1 Tax=Rhizobium viscosum TaxID=1673 RepID=A0ABR9IYM2_RHIVS|nr:hypothetical protein [Rhizobium viscosum]MBE1508278.1 hypothetical protein [Rhizobium viscosum]
MDNPEGLADLRPEAAQGCRARSLEEAGVIGRAKKKPFGAFFYDKLIQDGHSIRPVVDVFLLEVRRCRCRRRFPERNQRELVWLSPLEAARRVDEPDLEQLLLKFARSADRGGQTLRPG